METAQAQPTIDQQTDQDSLHRKALAVVGRCAARHFARRDKLKVQRADAGIWPVLHNGLYRVLADANKESDFSTELLAGSDMSRPGITATAILASLYSVASSQLDSAKQYHAHPDNIAEFQKLLDMLAPLVAGCKPRQESLRYTAAQTTKYQEQSVEAE
jgi:hypothetical protein